MPAGYGYAGSGNAKPMKKKKMTYGNKKKMSYGDKLKEKAKKRSF